jgi:hypothetical protein
MSATEMIWVQGHERRARFAPWQISEGATTPWAKIVPSLRVVAKIAAIIVARLAHIHDMGCDKRLAIDNFGHNASHAVMVNRP